MQNGGTFWSSFGAQFGATASPIEQLLERSDLTVGELLEEEDVIQECKYMNANLIKFLATRSSMEQLIRFAITSPMAEPTEAKRQNAARNAFVSSELFVCEVMPMLEVLFEHTELLQLLLSVLDAPAPLDPVVTSYFRKIMAVLIQRKHDELVSFIKTQPNIVSKLVDHIGAYSILELLILIGWDESNTQVVDVDWLFKQDLITKLVAKLSPKYEGDTEVHVNAARALIDIVIKCPVQQNNQLVTHLQTPQILHEVFQHLFSGSHSSLTNCMSLLTVLVQRRTNQNREFEQGGEDTPVLIAEIQKHLPRFYQLLTTPPKNAAIHTQYGHLDPPLGETRMKAVELFLVLFRSNCSSLNKDLVQLRVLDVLLKLFFQYSWNNLLHAQVESIIGNVLDNASPDIFASLFEDADFVSQVVQNFGDFELRHGRRQAFRPGYMGHLIRICKMLQQRLTPPQQKADKTNVDSVLAQDGTKPKDDPARPLLKQYLGDNKEWQELVSGKLQRELDRQNTVIGGIRPVALGKDHDPDDGGIELEYKDSNGMFNSSGSTGGFVNAADLLPSANFGGQTVADIMREMNDSFNAGESSGFTVLNNDENVVLRFDGRDEDDDDDELWAGDSDGSDEDDAPVHHSAKKPASPLAKVAAAYKTHKKKVDKASIMHKYLSPTSAGSGDKQQPRKRGGNRGNSDSDSSDEEDEDEEEDPADANLNLAQKIEKEKQKKEARKVKRAEAREAATNAANAVGGLNSPAAAGAKAAATASPSTPQTPPADDFDVDWDSVSSGSSNNSSPAPPPANLFSSSSTSTGAATGQSPAASPNKNNTSATSATPPKTPTTPQQQQNDDFDVDWDAVSSGNASPAATSATTTPTGVFSPATPTQPSPSTASSTTPTATTAATTKVDDDFETIWEAPAAKSSASASSAQASVDPLKQDSQFNWNAFLAPSSASSSSSSTSSSSSSSSLGPLSSPKADDGPSPRPPSEFSDVNFWRPPLVIPPDLDDV